MKEESISFTDEAANMKQDVPAAGKYSEVDLELFKSRASKWMFKSDNSNGYKLKPFKKNNSPSPSSYLIEKSFDKSIYEKNHKFHTISK